MVNIVGKLVTDQANATYDGHRVRMSYTEIVDLSINIPEDEIIEGQDYTVEQPVIRSAPVETNGTFTLSLPDVEGHERQAPFVFEVSAPNGELLHQENFGDEPQEISIEVDPQARPGILSSGQQSPGKILKINGQVLDIDGRRKGSNLRVILWARTDDMADDEYLAMLVTNTDGGGYFSGIYPTGTYAEAYGQIGGDVETRIPIRLEEGAFPTRVILVTSLDSVISGEGGVPRLPDQDDLAASPEVYTDDLTGTCVTFTKPNRTLNEFSYYELLRTTDPEIKGLTLNEPQRVPQAVKWYVSKIAFDRVIFNQISEGAPQQPAQPTQPLPAPDPEIPVFTDFAAHAVADSGMLSNETRRVLAQELEQTQLNVHPSVLKTIAEDPDSFTPVGLMTADRHSAFLHLKDLLKNLSKKVSGRSMLDMDNPVDWDDTPTFYQATTIAHGHILYFRQTWKADGYSLGDLVYSLPLAPAQKKQIAVVDWNRRDIARRTESETETERLYASISRDRDINEIVSAVLLESTVGGSSSSTSSIGGGIGGGIIGAGFGALLGIGGGGSKASSRAWQQSSRLTASQAIQRLRDRTMQSASAVRAQRSTVVQTVRQSEDVTVTTESVANYNHCHALTIQYFEVLRHFLVQHELVDVQECLFIPLTISPFDMSKALRWRDALRRRIRNRRLRGAFAAMERIRLNYAGSDFPTGSYASETLDVIEGDMRIQMSIVRPRDLTEDEDLIEHFDENWSAIARLGAPFGIDIGAFYKQYFINEQIEDRTRDRVFREEIAPGIAQEFVNNIQVYLVDSRGNEHPANVDPTLVSEYRAGRRHYVKLNFADTPTPIPREDIESIRIRTSTDISERSRIIVKSVYLRYRTPHLSHNLVRNNRVNDDLFADDPVTIYTPLARAERRDPRKEDRELTRQLLAHLNENLEYYHKVLWWSMDPERRFMLLDGFQAPNAGGRSVASVVENRILGIVGNCIVMPVAKGFKLDPTYEVDEEEVAELIEQYAPESDANSIRISVPTNGVFAEAVMGSCNSCEQIDDSRFWKWNEVPTEAAPAIADVSAGSRAAQAPDLTPSDFSNALINFQQAPAAPNPTGLAAALQLLSTPNLFRDLAGLNQTQANALTALQSALGTSQFFGGQAAKIIANSEGLDKVLENVRDAKNQGLITQKQAQEVTKRILGGMVTDDRRPKPQLTEEKSVQKVIKEAANDPGSSVSVKRSSDGISDTVEVNRQLPGQGSGVGNINYVVPGTVQNLQQPHGCACWATITTMMMSWRDQTGYAIDEAMSQIGANWLQIYNNGFTPAGTSNCGTPDGGLAINLVDQFLTDASLTSQPPMSYTVEGILNLLQTYGPLWVTTDVDNSPSSFALHARLITGIFGDGTPHGTQLIVRDPANGTQYTRSFHDFMFQYERAFVEVGENFPNIDLIQIIHFANNTGSIGGSIQHTRITDGLQAIYSFEEGSGATINDQAGSMNLQIQNTGQAIWVTGGLSLSGSEVTASSTSSLIQAMKASDEFTIELWIQPSASNSGEILSLAGNGSQRNFILSQNGDQYDVGIKTSTNSGNQVHELSSSPGTASPDMTHIIVTRSSDGSTQIFINGAGLVGTSFGGDLSNWSNSHQFVLNNGGNFAGTIALVAIYDRALGTAEIAKNYLAG